ncbi:nuclear transcription factor Y subunit C-6-like [Dendrobium catenatum]|uniref:Nuclear transcription factor Y subunit C-9 n=1 Tax=Dendrobium catenatum TaxID=906689 RepID=A0A2I0WGM6_9ASPA|nr:nuclear transcription factor Y subunit C-6-like [Dendrobium catenatum]PKU74820.1 Nuclear transcription factor Y subunit C-9 [Dendrobium catenatum]
MDGQGHNRPPPPSGDVPHLPNFAADADPNLYPEQVVHQPQPGRCYWADQYREMEETTDFEKQRIPLGTIKRIMMADEDVDIVSNEAPVLLARACEMFILELTHKGWAHADQRCRRTIKKEDIIAAVNETDYCDFLVPTITTEEPTEPDSFELATGPADLLS